ncbi:hypothetical protein [Streptomyces niveus]|uniref:hypothetical protein n=1 Tax=Streptomyces niveus TaxID=193462 RepID=UPI00341E4E52
MAYQPPDKGRPFIAYEKKARPAAGPDGQTVRARPSVYVREHVGVKVAAFKEKTLRTDDGPFVTGRVTFDAASVGLEHDFHASVQAGTTAAQLLADACTNDEPVTVVIETSRRYAPKGGEPISPLTPVHELRGIVGDATKANAETTNRNCRNLLVCVNGEFTDEIVSDPEEWQSLRENRDGSLAPDGWAVFGGAVIPARTLDITGQIEAALEKYLGPVGGTLPAAVRTGRPPVRAAHAVEAKPWDGWNTDGRFNYGSYLATAARETYAQAYRMLDSAGGEPHADPTAVSTLGKLLMGMADRIQLGIYRNTDGVAIRADRSHHEARAWIDFVVSHQPALTYTAEMADPTNAEAVQTRNAWASQVIATVGRLMDAVPTFVSTPFVTGTDGVPVIRPVDDLQHSRFETLLAHEDVGLANWPDRVFPLLTDQFGTHDLERIEAVRFEYVLATWEADPAAFLTAARASAAARHASEPPAAAA